jgi:hypothetical protein
MALKVLLLLLLPYQAAQTTILECTADTFVPGLNGSQEVLKIDAGHTLLLAFRMGAVEGWRIQKAVLLLHRAELSKPMDIHIAPVQGVWNERTQEVPVLGAFQPAQERSKPDGWLAIPVPPEFLRKGATGIAVRGSEQKFHARESAQFSPYLAIQGTK